ncbi:MAG: deoxyribose-phosphate aldolase [Marinifilaceae bacterium]
MNEINKIIEAYNWANLDDRVMYTLDGVVERETKQAYTRDNLKQLVTYVDYTTLKATDNTKSVSNFIADLKKRLTKSKLPNVASICVFPNFITAVKQAIANDNIKACCVSGAFPASQSFLEVKLLECQLAVEAGAEEIDVVINVGELMAENYDEVMKELSLIREVCKGRTLKVILETGELKSLEMIFRAALIAMYAGADFIKTSSGKVAVNATGEAVYIMAEAIKAFYEATGKRVGIKVSGGIGKAMTALRYVTIVRLSLGAAWLTPELFRIGASSLLDDLLKEVKFFEETAQNS